MSEILDYDTAGKQKFGNKATPWVARWLLEKPNDDPFYPMQFRHELGSILVHEYGIRMPDVEKAIRQFRELGMIARVDGAQKHGSPHYYVALPNEAWGPYAEFLTNHITLHVEEFAAIDAAIPVEDLKV